MRFGVCGGPARFPAIVAAGAEYLEPAVAYDATPEGPEKVWAEHLAQLRDSGLTAEVWNCFLPGDLKIVGPQADWQRYVRYIHQAIPRVAAAGAQVIVFGSGGSRSAPADYDSQRAVEDFEKAVRTAAQAAGGAGITFAVEHLERRETNILNSLAETAAFVKMIGMPNVKCTADLFHLEAEAEPNSVLRDVGRSVGHAHLADTAREAPGTGTAKISEFLTELRRVGYDGRVSIEANWHDFDSQVGPALKSLRETWARARSLSSLS